jgi:hypothetical protein
MSNIIKYSDIYERLVNKLAKGQKLNDKEDKIHKKLCFWLGMDFANETFSFSDDNCGN